MAQTAHAHNSADDAEDIESHFRLAVREAAEDADDLNEAVDRLLDTARRRPDIYALLMSPHEQTAARQVLGGFFRQERRAIWARPVGPDARVAVLANAVGAALMDFRLPGGLPLAQASSEEVREAAGFYARQAADMAWKGAWLDRIAASLPDGKTVSEEFTEAQLAAMREATR